MKFIKFIISNLIFVIMISAFAFAGTGRIEFKDPTVTRDKSFNLVMKVKSDDVRLKNATITIQYDPNMLQFEETASTDTLTISGGAGTVSINGVDKGEKTRTLEYQIKFKALSAGDTEVTVLDQQVVDTTDNLVNIKTTGKSSVKVKPLNTQSKNANLSTLELTPAEVSPAFDQNTLIYNAEVNSDIDQLTISAIPEEKDAVVAISGNENFVAGTSNKVTILVTAPDNKTTKEYSINVTKLETGVTGGATSIVDGQKITSNKYSITVLTKPENVEIPSGYKQLTHETGGDGTVVAYAPEDVAAKETPEVYLVYGEDANGEKDFYRIDTRNGDYTIQRYIQDSNSGDYESLKTSYDKLSKNYESLSSKYSIILPVCIGALALVLILLIVLIIVIIKNGHKNDKNNKYDIDEEEDDDEYFGTNNNRTNLKSKYQEKEDLDDDDVEMEDFDTQDTKKNNDEDIEDLD